MCCPINLYGSALKVTQIEMIEWQAASESTAVNLEREFIGGDLRRTGHG